MSLVPGRRRRFGNCRFYWLPLASRYYTDTAGVYQRHLPPAQHTVGKLTRQKIERKHLTLRTHLKRLARKMLCFSRSRFMHDLLIGLYMNYVEFGFTA
jgi:insertion element IS1 protein InsB